MTPSELTGWKVEIEDCNSSRARACTVLRALKREDTDHDLVELLLTAFRVEHEAGRELQAIKDGTSQGRRAS